MAPWGFLFLGCGGFLIHNKKKKKNVENHSINIPTKFGFNWSNSFREEDCNVKVCRRQWRMMTEDDDGSKVMTVTIL